jgi:hypothetical protein
MSTRNAKLEQIGDDFLNNWQNDAMMGFIFSFKTLLQMLLFFNQF